MESSVEISSALKEGREMSSISESEDLDTVKGGMEESEAYALAARPSISATRESSASAVLESESDKSASGESAVLDSAEISSEITDSVSISLLLSELCKAGISDRWVLSTGGLNEDISLWNECSGLGCLYCTHCQSVSVLVQTVL